MSNDRLLRKRNPCEADRGRNCIACKKQKAIHATAEESAMEQSFRQIVSAAKRMQSQCSRRKEQRRVATSIHEMFGQIAPFLLEARLPDRREAGTGTGM